MGANSIKQGLGRISFQVDCSGGTSDTYGALSGSVNSSNTTYTVSLGSYISGSLQVYLNGQLQTQGTAEDWDETTPTSGTFDFNTAPTTGDIIIAVYQRAIITSGNADTLDGSHASAFATITGSETLTNKTLTDPQIDNNVMARAYKSGGGQLNLVDSTPTQVTFESESYDLGGNFASNTFTAPQDGYYRVSARITFNNTIAAKLYVAQIYINDASAADAYGHSGVAQSLGVPVEWTGFISSGGTVKIYATSYSGGDTVDIVHTSRYTWVTVELIGI